MADYFIGQIVMFGCNFAPRSFSDCNGQLLAIAQNTALFSILGTNYGGDGRTTFGLPNLQGRAALHDGGGNGPGLSSYSLGQTGGAETVTLNSNQIPQHNHAAVGNNADGTASSPNGAVWAAPGADRDIKLYSSGAPNINMPPLANTGGGQAHNNMMPYLAIRFVICTQGVFPSRN